VDGPTKAVPHVAAIHKGGGVPCRCAVNTDASRQSAGLGVYCSPIGGGRYPASSKPTSAKMRTDCSANRLFVWCIVDDPLPALKHWRSGYEPEMEYVECLTVNQVIVDLIYEGASPHGLFDLEPAESAVVSGPRICPTREQARIGKPLLSDIQSGKFDALLWRTLLASPR